MATAMPNSPAPRLATQVRTALEALLEPYGLVLLGPHGVAAALIAAASFLVPAHGLLGLAGMLFTGHAAQVFAPYLSTAERAWLACNGLLVALVLALFFKPSLPMSLLTLAACLVALLAALALRPLVDRHVGVPLLSLPFVLAGWLALLAARRMGGMQPAVPIDYLDPTWLAEPLAGFLRALGAIMLQPYALAGLFVLAALVLWSRWAALLAVLGYAAAALTYQALGGPPSDLSLHLLGYNAILTSLAVGGVLVVLSPASIAAAALAAVVTTLVGAALLQALEPLGIGVLAAPFVLVTDGLLLALVQRRGPGPLTPVAGQPGRPEDNLAALLQLGRRYPPAGVPLFYLPVLGRWTVTQGPHGALTHQGLWAHAWDFEIEDDSGHRWRNPGTDLRDFYAFGAPVVAPADGRVVAVVSHWDDNPIGHIDAAHNWGNTIVLAHAGGVYSALSHLQKGSVAVRDGEVVVRGQLLARVGNSGRSPVPHLHFQIQRGPEVGAPTLPGELLHYMRVTPKVREYETHGCPQTGDRIEALLPDANLRRALVFEPGSQFGWSIQRGKQRTTETWLSTIDSSGRRQLETHAASASIYSDESYATVLDYRGSPQTLLALFALAAARLPFTAESGTQGRDSPSLLPFAPLAERVGLELMLPFTAGASLATCTTIRTDGDGYLVQTLLDAKGSVARRLPDRLLLRLEVRRGPIELQAFRGDVCVVHAKVLP